MSEKRLSLKQNMVFFTGGSLFYLVCQWLITVLVVRIDSYGAGGMLSISTTITGFFFVLSTFGIRNFQVSDTAGKYSPSMYISTRLLTSCFGLIACVAFAFCNVQYSLTQQLCIVLYMLFRLTEATVDVLAAEEQKAWRMDYIGLSFLLRGVISLGSFVVMMLLTHDLPLTLLVMAGLTMLVVVFVDGRKVRAMTHFTLHPSLRESLPLLKEATPLMLNSALMTVLAGVPRYFLEMYHGETVMGIYASIATPAVIVQAACSFIYSPLVAPLSEKRAVGDWTGYRKVFLGALTGIGGLVVTIVIGATLLGRWGLNLLFGESILPYAALLIPVLLTSFCVALIYFFEVPLTITRQLKTMTMIHACAVVVSIALSMLLIPAMGMPGVNLVMYISAGGDALAMAVVALTSMKKRK